MCRIFYDVDLKNRDGQLKNALPQWNVRIGKNIRKYSTFLKNAIFD